MTNNTPALACLQVCNTYLLQKIDSRETVDRMKEELLVEYLVVEENASYPVVIRYGGKDLADYRGFRLKTSEKTAGLNVSVSSKEYPTFIAKIRTKTEKVGIYACPGYQNEVWVYENVVYDCKTKTFQYHDQQEHGNAMRLLRTGYIDSKNLCRPKLYLTNKSPNEIADNFFSNLVECYTNIEVFLCVGVILGYAFWDIFQTLRQGFPAVIFTGEQQSGKSTLERAMLAIFGLVGGNVIVSANSTVHAIREFMSSRLNIPLVLDELESFDTKTIQAFVKISYGAISRAKGGKNGIEQKPLFTNFIGASNTFFVAPKPEVLSRIVSADMKKDEFLSENFRYFDDESLKELSQILPLILDFRNKVPSYYRLLEPSVAKLTTEKNPRLIHNLTISCTMWAIVQRILNKKLFDIEQMIVAGFESYESYLGIGISNSDVMLNYIGKLIQDDTMICGSDYRLIGTTLRLRVNRFVEKFKLANAKNPDNLFTEKEFRAIVRNDQRFNLKSENLKGLGRAIFIDISNEEVLLELVRGKENIRPKSKEEHEEELNASTEELEKQMAKLFSSIAKEVQNEK